MKLLPHPSLLTVFLSIVWALYLASQIGAQIQNSLNRGFLHLKEFGAVSPTIPPISLIPPEHRFAFPAVATLGNYPAAVTGLSGNATVTPDAAPTDTTSISVSADTNFKGVLAADPATGAVQITNAYPAGTHTITVRAFGPNGTVTKTFGLTVNSAPVGGGLSFGAANYAVANPAYSTIVGDFNRDGKQDIAAHDIARVSILLGDGAGRFSAPTIFPAGSNTQSFATADFNGDGILDIAAPYTNTGTDQVDVLIGNGDGTFAPKTSFPVAPGPMNLTVADFNSDGRMDIAAASPLVGPPGGGSANTAVFSFGTATDMRSRSAAKDFSS